MGLWSYLRGTDILESTSSNGNGESRSLPAPENQYPLLTPPFLAGKVTPVQSLAIGDVWAAVRVLADAASSLPIHVYRKTEAGRERVTSGKLVDLLDRPGPATTQADLVSTLMCHVLIWGNAYLAKYREGEEVAQLSLLHPERVKPELKDGQLKWRYTPPTGPERMLTEADLVHIRGLSVDGLTGLSAVSQASRVLGLSDELVKHALSYFTIQTDGGAHRPAGVLRLGTSDMTPSPEGTDRYREDLRNKSRPHGILVVEGDVEYVPIAQKLDDSQFVEQRRLAAQEVCRVFRIPSHMLNAGTGGDSLTYSTSESMSIDFVKYALAPWLRRIELAVSNDTDLAFQRQFIKFEVDGLLRADALTRAQIYEKALDPVVGWLQRSEVRALEDLPPESTPPPIQQTVEQLLARPPEVGVNGSSSS
ncbi:MAG TPA: phage portal protein [Thermoleophilaceae bacterium]